jgi:hypothetical protein
MRECLSFLVALPFLLTSRRFWRTLGMLCQSEAHYRHAAHVGEPLSNDAGYVSALVRNHQQDAEALALHLRNWKTLDEALNGYERVVEHNGHILYI